MPRSTAPLRVVKGADVYDPRDPEDVLTLLFAAEAEQAALLAATRDMIDRAVRAYQRREGLLVRPRTELLRTRFAPPAARQ